LVAILAVCVGVTSILSLVWGYKAMNYDDVIFARTMMTTIGYDVIPYESTYEAIVYQRYPTTSISFIANISGFIGSSIHNALHEAHVRWPMNSTQAGWYYINSPSQWSFTVIHGRYWFIGFGIGALITLALMILFVCSCFKRCCKKPQYDAFVVNHYDEYNYN
jgi:hypothetical protein